MNIGKLYILIVLLLVTIIIGGLVVFLIHAQFKDSNFILYISNQSYTIARVDIAVRIDGEPALNQDFFVKDGHNWREFRFFLSQGNHQIYVTSLKGEAQLEQEFEIKDRHWATVRSVQK